MYFFKILIFEKFQVKAIKLTKIINAKISALNLKLGIAKAIVRPAVSDNL